MIDSSCVIRETEKKQARIKICMGSSCFARGNDRNLEILEDAIRTQERVLEIELKGSRCENKCSCGPNIEINGFLYNHMDPGALTDLLNSVFKQAAAESKTEEKKEN